MGRDKPVSRREGKGECNNEGQRRKNTPALPFCLFSLRRGDVVGKNRKDSEKMRGEAAGICCIVSSGGAVFDGAERRAINC